MEVLILLFLWLSALYFKARLTKRNVQQEQEEMAKQYFAELRKLSYLMLQEIENLQRQIEVQAA